MNTKSNQPARLFYNQLTVEDQMDESLKIVIATLSGFIIAFLAEPVRIYFQGKAKINSIKLALYKEMCHNYVVIFNNFQIYDDDKDKGVLIKRIQEELPDECYK